MPVDFNGSVDVNRTALWAAGRPSEVVQFFEGVSRRIAELPADELENHRRILLTEERSATSGQVSTLLAERFGRAGPGLVQFLQLGLRRLTINDAQTWADRAFCRENMVVTIVGKPPPELGIEVRPGSAVPAPVTQPLPGPMPRWRVGQDGGVAIGVITGHDAAAGAAHRILERRLYERLRSTLGISYSMQGVGIPIDDDHLHRVLTADCLPQSAVAVRDALIAETMAMAERGPTAEELARDLDELERQTESVRTGPWVGCTTRPTDSLQAARRPAGRTTRANGGTSA